MAPGGWEPRGGPGQGCRAEREKGLPSPTRSAACCCTCSSAHGLVLTCETLPRQHLGTYLALSNDRHHPLDKGLEHKPHACLSQAVLKQPHSVPCRSMAPDSVHRSQESQLHCVLGQLVLAHRCLRLRNEPLARKALGHKVGSF